MQNVAVIGAGPGGLAVARYLKSEGLEPVLFEQGERIGGQWSADPGHSGVWPAMRTNTSRIMTAFSDLPHDAHSPTYPTNEAMGEYLQRYAEQFDLIRHIRFKTPVRELRRDADRGWIVRTDTGEESFEKVIVATGRYNKPAIPDVPGLKSFSGAAGVRHTFCYKRPEDYRGLRVLVTRMRDQFGRDCERPGHARRSSRRPDQSQAAICVAEARYRGAAGSSWPSLASPR